MGHRHREGTAAERSIGQGGNRGGVESQAWRVAAKSTVMLATGTRCCGPRVVLVCTSKARAVNMKTNLVFSPHLSHFFAFPTLFFVPLALRLSFTSFPHERCRGTFEPRRRGNTPAGMPRRCMTDLREVTEGCKWRRKVANSLKETSLTIVLREMTADHCVVNRAEDPGNTHTSFSVDHTTQEMYHLLPFSPSENRVCFLLPENTFAGLLQTVDDCTNLTL